MNSPKILVVDDEPTILRMVRQGLSERGYEVHAASGPAQALELAKGAPCFDLVMSDVIMPGMCGPEFVRQLTQMCPNTAIVLMSGYITPEGIPEHAAFITKPFRMADLYSVVEKALA